MSLQMPGRATIALCAFDYVHDGDVVGMGTGHEAASFIRVLGERVKNGLRIQGVPTSGATAELASALGIPLATLSEVEAIDVTIDGADEVDPKLNLIKGRGGALTREKIVAAASRRLVILVGREKLVSVLGLRGFLPVEVVPFGLPFCTRQLRSLGLEPEPRQADGRLFVTDNGNHLIDCKVSEIARPEELHSNIDAIPGVVETGLFLGMADTVLIQDGDAVEVRRR
jgi:ribose 5-phosphate isomerase A